MKTILVPTDFSSCAKNATTMAINIAKENQGSIHFLHLMDVPSDWMSLNRENQMEMYADVNRKVRQAENELKNLVEKARRAGVEAQFYLHFNKGAENIVGHADNYEMDLIVMGSNGAVGAKEFFMGSNAQKVIRTANVPVIVIKNAYEKRTFNDLVYASDFEHYNMHGFEKIVNLATLFDAKIHLLFINTPMNFTDTSTLLERVAPFQEAGVDVVASFDIYNCYNFEQGLKEFSQEKGDILALVTSGNSGVSRYFSGNITESIVNHLDFPILSIND